MNNDKLIELNSIVELIISDTNLDIKETLINVVDGLDIKDQRLAYRHMNTLFLNADVNRLNEIGISVKPRLHESRKIICELFEIIK